MNLGLSTAKPKPGLWRCEAWLIRTWIIWLVLAVAYPVALAVVLALLKVGVKGRSEIRGRHAHVPELTTGTLDTPPCPQG